MKRLEKKSRFGEVRKPPEATFRPSKVSLTFQNKQIHPTNTMARAIGTNEAKTQKTVFF